MFPSDSSLSVMESLRIPVWVFDVDRMRILWANREALSFWNAESLQQLRNRDMSVDMSVSVRKRLLQTRDDCGADNSSKSENWTVYPKGVPQTAEVVMSAFALTEGRTALLVHLLYERKDETSDTLRSAQALLHTSAMISLYSGELELLYSNPAARSIAVKVTERLDEKICRAQDLEFIKHELAQHGNCDVEFEVNTIYGTVWHSMNFQLSPDAVSGKKAILLSATDITERRKAQREAYVLAYTDSLTGLSNRIALLEYLNRLSARENAGYGLLFLDLDRFKLVNDSLGHAIGDKLLVEVAHRLRQCLQGRRGFISRLGGDEFVMVLEDKFDKKSSAAMAEQVLETMGAVIALEGYQLSISPSIGICMFPENGESTTAIMQHADVAMYSAKSSSSGYCFFDKSMNQNMEARLELETDLVTALSDDQFEVYYQPKICTRTDTVVGMEALIRWMHPEKGKINPLDFISIAEETGLIVKIGEWIMREAMSQQRKWTDQGYPVTVSINISPIQFKSTSLVESITAALDYAQCDPSHIEFEITESTLLGEAEMVFQTLDRLSTMGLKLALDDFGTGYSNLAYLRKYPLTCLKIDRQFVQDVDQTAILEMILRMGRVLGLSIVAEGVETIEQISWLKHHDCDILQGFFFSHPLPEPEATRYLAEYTSTFTTLVKAA